ncbi:MAG: phenylalanine--tRNA ligase subunit beta [Clostridia bacterium]|nr:phenylalanine--tRNA ligase subunit beta [Clostridia bacterium]
MNVSLNWLKEYVDLDENISVKEVIDRLTMTGSKVEKIEKFGEKTEKVYTARVEKITPHSEDNKLFIIDISFGDSKCSAVAKIPDIEVGDIIPVALPGAKVIGKEIKVGEVKGIKSSCMVCHILDLGLSQKDFPWVKPSGLISFPKDIGLGKDINEVLGLGDYIIEFEITPNRPDCLSVEGIARELAVTFNKPCKKLFQDIKPEFINVNKVDTLDVKIDSKNCNRYMLSVVDNIEVKESPYEIQLKLIKSGIKPINNIVDITNYVMLELGQPMHAFDYAKVNGGIIVREAKSGEVIETLDSQTRKLTDKNLVIADYDKPIAIAGVMGGLESSITKNTTKIVIESANFVRGSIRNTSRSQYVRTDASAKYEKGLAPELTAYALNRVHSLLRDILGVNASAEIVDVYPNVQSVNTINLDYNKINNIIGEELDKQSIVKILEDLSIKVENDVAHVPYYRQDVEIAHDIAEEIARIYGYDKLNSKLPDTSLTFGSKNKEQKLEDKIKTISLANGYSEIYTYTFFSKELLDRMEIAKDSPLRDCIKITNPLSQEFEYMRTTTMPLMLEALERNYTKKNIDVKLFELGKIFLGNDNIKKGDLGSEKQVLTLGMYNTSDNVDFYSIKEVVENILNYFKVLENDYDIKRYTENIVYHPGASAKITIGEDVIALFGKLSPKVVKNYILPENTYIAEIYFENIVKYAKGEVKFVELPKYPAVDRDIAFIIDEDVLAYDIQKVIKSVNPNIIEKIELFDVYEGEQIEKGKKSMAYRVKLRLREKTLEEAEIVSVMDSIVSKLESEFKVVFRK